MELRERYKLINRGMNNRIIISNVEKIGKNIMPIFVE